MFVSLVSVRCCQVEVSTTGRSLVQRIPAECGVSECDTETSTMRMSRPTSAVEARKIYVRLGHFIKRTSLFVRRNK